MTWKSIDNERPKRGQLIIASGTWCGEIIGEKDGVCIGLGEWCGSYVDLGGDTYSISLFDVTHWMPAPSAP